LKTWKDQLVLIAVTLALAASSADAQVRRFNKHNANGTVSLPFQISDGHGETWMVYQPFMIQMQGNMPVYQQAATITINGIQPNLNTQPKQEEKTGELIFENLQVGGFTLTRRILFSTDEGYARVVDIIKNTGAQDQQMNLQEISYINFGVQSAQMIMDPKKTSQNIGWVGTTAAGNGKAALELYGGPGTKMVPTIESPQGSNNVISTVNMTLAAGKEVAFAHIHMVVTTQEAGVQWSNNLKSGKMFADLPKEVRAAIINFRVRNSLLGDLEVLRGDLLDVVELRTGDKFNGNLTETSYKLDTFYGTVDIPVEKVVSIINAGQFRPRQLVVTADGQIFGGHLQKSTIELELTSGQKTQIPLAQISRLGYRRRADEKEDSADDEQMQAPYMLMTSGERVSVAMPAGPIAVVTRYGTLQLSPDVISSIVFNSDDSGVHTIELTDGSKFNGLVTATEFDVKLTTAAKDQEVKFPVAALNRIVFSTRADTKEDPGATLTLKKDDLLMGTLQGDLKLDTAFDTIALHADELRQITHSKESPADLSVTTWDGTVFSGQLEEQSVQCHLKSGIDLSVPIGLVETYTNPNAVPPKMILDRIKGLVTSLNSDDWKDRDAAEKQLTTLGPGVASTLKQMRDAQPPEAQQRIDSVLKQVQKPASAPGYPQGVVSPYDNDGEVLLPFANSN
jgi:hypothetical protein